MRTIPALLAAAGIAVLTGPALAGSYAPGCTREPQASWKSIDLASQKAAAMGYSISKTKVSGSCYEIYATKDGRRFELFFNPVTFDLVHTRAR